MYIPQIAIATVLFTAAANAAPPEFSTDRAKQIEQEAWTSVETILQRIKPPVIPDRTVQIADFGGVGDGVADNRQAIAKAIDSVSQTGGKIVLPAGDYFVDGPIHLKSNVHLHLRKDARIFFSSNAESYLPVVKVRFEGTVCYNYSPLIYGIGLKNFAITGEGVIDGNAQDWSQKWRKKQKPDKAILRQMGNDTIPDEHRVFGNGFLDLDGDGKDDGHGDGNPHFLRPSLFEIHDCENVLLDGLTFKDSPFWTVHPVFSKNIIIRNLNVRGATLNDDGIDPDSCEDVLIEGCTVKTRDDAISIKAGRDQDAWNRPACRNIIVRNNRLLANTNACCIGSEMSGGVEYVFAENNLISGGRYALNFKCNLDRGGQVQHIYLRNFEIESCQDAMFLFCMDYHSWRGNKFPTKFNDFYVSNIRCKSVAKVPFDIVGVEAEPIRRVFLSNIQVGHAGGESILEHAEDILFDQVTIGGKSFTGSSGGGK
jgi:polygalacturonase